MVKTEFCFCFIQKYIICFYAIFFIFLLFSIENLEETGDNGCLPIGMEKVGDDGGEGKETFSLENEVFIF